MMSVPKQRPLKLKSAQVYSMRRSCAFRVLGGSRARTAFNAVTRTRTSAKKY